MSVLMSFQSLTRRNYLMSKNDVDAVWEALSPIILKPPPLLTVSQWCDEFRMLSSESSASPGKWHNHRTPYLTGIMDAFNDPTVETVVVKSSSQIGKSEALLNIIGYVITQDPGPILFVQPTLAIAEAFAKDRFVPMIRDCPEIRKRVSLNPNSRKALVQDTTLHRTFPGGHLTLAGANSAASLASRPIRVLLLDEVDRYPASLTAEGDVVSLARKRTTAFYNKKIAMVSTPTVKGASRIESAFEASDQQKYHVPCPHCAHMQVLVFGDKTAEYGLKWDDGKPETAWYECIQCHARIHNTDKARMLLQGHWKPTCHENMSGKVRGFHINELYSPFVSFADLAENFLDSRRLPETLRTFINTSLGEVFEETEELPDITEIELRAEEYTKVPGPVMLLTAGVDIQGDRIELEVVGWGKHFESWGIERQTIYGDPTQPAIWNQIDLYLKREFEHEGGGALRIACTCIDSGFCTDQVYKYVRDKAGRRIFAVKGMAGPGRALVGRPLKNQYSRVLKVFPVGVDSVKDIILAHLLVENDGQAPYMHFPKAYGTDFYEQLTAEKCVTRHKSGQPVRVYIKVRQRNEALDIRVYARAALELLKIDIDKLAAPFGEVRASGVAISEPKQSPKRQPVLDEIMRRMRSEPRKRGGFVNNWK